MRITNRALALTIAFFAMTGIAKAQSSGDQSFGYLGGTPPADWAGFKLRDGYTTLRRAGVPVPKARASQVGSLNLYFDMPANSVPFDPSGKGPVFPSTLEDAKKILEGLAGTKVKEDPWTLGLVKSRPGAVASDEAYEFWVDPNGKVTVRLDPAGELSKGEAKFDTGLRSAAAFYDSVAKIMKARGFPVPEQLHTPIVDALEQARGKSLTTAQRYRADGLFAEGESGLEIMKGMGVKMSEAVEKRIGAFDEQVRRYPGIRTPQYRGSQDTDWTLIMDAAAPLKDSDVKIEPGSSVAVSEPAFADPSSDAVRSSRPARTTGISRLIEERVEGKKDEAKDVEKR